MEQIFPPSPPDSDRGAHGNTYSGAEHKRLEFIGKNQPPKARL